MGRVIVVIVVLAVAACSASPRHQTLAELRDVDIEVKDEKVKNSAKKAIKNYKKYLKRAPVETKTPEAMRRLADLKVEHEYELEESEEDFESRAQAPQKIKRAAGKESDRDAITLYNNLLKKFPGYKNNDRVMYQLSRAYEEQGEVEKAMQIMNRIVLKYPGSQYINEVQYRRGEYFFVRKKHSDAEAAYKVVIKSGKKSAFYEISLYKLGWTYYKQSKYVMALHYFLGSLDNKVAKGYDLNQKANLSEKRRVDDTYRAISLSFSAQSGGPNAVTKYFSAYGKRPYEHQIYSRLGEHYLGKKLYQNAAASYNAFVYRHPLHEESPYFSRRVIGIYKIAGFKLLELEEKKTFARRYGLVSRYWKKFNIKRFPDIEIYLRDNLIHLANHYHALYRDKRFASQKEGNYHEATLWYWGLIDSFPGYKKTAAMNYQLAELLLQHKDYSNAAYEYERTAYLYPRNKKSAGAAYASIYAFRESLNRIVTQEEKEKSDREEIEKKLMSSYKYQIVDNRIITEKKSESGNKNIDRYLDPDYGSREDLKQTGPGKKTILRYKIISSSLRYEKTFPGNSKSATVLSAAAADLYEAKAYDRAVDTAMRLVNNYPKAKKKQRLSSWLIAGHAYFDSGNYVSAEKAYVKALKLSAGNGSETKDLRNNLAASIYKQGEVASKENNNILAVRHFQRIAKVAPKSDIRPIAEFDAAMMLIKNKNWRKSVKALETFRRSHPGHKLQSEALKNIALAYKHAGRYSKAAASFEQVERISDNDDIKRDALLLAAQMYEKAKKYSRAIKVYQRHIALFPKPLEYVLDNQQKIAMLYKKTGDNKSHYLELNKLIAMESRAGTEQTDRTRYLAANANLLLIEPKYKTYASIRLVRPFKKNLNRKKDQMLSVVNELNTLVKFGSSEITAAATFYIAEIYYNFNKSLIESERPSKLNAMELEQYELAIEEQAYPFEEKSITVHQKNHELLARGVCNEWIDKSLDKLGKLMPARYIRSEQSTGYIKSINSYQYHFATKIPKPEVDGKSM